MRYLPVERLMAADPTKQEQEELGRLRQGIDALDDQVLRPDQRARQAGPSHRRDQARQHLPARARGAGAAPPGRGQSRARCRTARCGRSSARSCPPAWRWSSRCASPTSARRAPSPRARRRSISARRRRSRPAARSTTCSAPSSRAMPITAWCRWRIPPKAPSAAPSTCCCRRRCRSAAKSICASTRTCCPRPSRWPA